MATQPTQPYSNAPEEKENLLHELEQLKQELFDARFYNLVTDQVSKILAVSGNIDKVANLIKAYLNLHTCYINYDIDTESLKANVAGLATNFGQWFNLLARTLKGIPFSFMGESPVDPAQATSKPLNAAEFLKNIDNILVLPSEHYCPLVPTNDIAKAGIKIEDIQDFLTSRLGELLIIPLKKYRGVLLLIKKEYESFNMAEKNLFKTIGRHIAITLDNIYHRYHDELGLKNITFFKNQLQLLEEQQKKYAVLSFKLKGLQKINDEYSYEQGNDFIVSNTERLKWILRELNFENVDNLVARTSGVILMVALPGIETQEELKEMSQFISKKLADPYSLIDKHYLELGSSIRIGGCLSIDSEGFETLLNKVNDALYFSRQYQNTSISLYTKELEEEKEKRKHIMNVFKIMEQNKGILDGPDRFFLYYQPKMDVRSNLIIGFEALIRLNTVRYGMIGPNLFIEMAEKENYIWLLDQFVLTEACKQIKDWTGKGIEIPVSINMSRYSLRKKECIHDIKEIFNKLNFFPYRHLLQIEITETGLLDDICLNILKEINKTLDIKLSIDDIGKSNANLHTLLHLYINNLIEAIKIDKLYIDRILANNSTGKPVNGEDNEAQLDEEGCKYILSLLNMFNGLFVAGSTKKPKIICEGVEHEKQVKWLIEHNFIYIQGYYFGRPAKASDYEKKLENQNNDYKQKMSGQSEQ